MAWKEMWYEKNVKREWQIRNFKKCDEAKKCGKEKMQREWQIRNSKKCGEAKKCGKEKM